MIQSHNAAGLVTTKSHYSVPETIDRLSLAIKGVGLIEFARIDHSANAKSVGMDLRPTLLLVFGNPKGGTPLMLDQQTSGIDLPFKALCWQDEVGTVWLSYNDPHWLVQRHGLGAISEESISAISKGMEKLVAQAVTN